MTQTSPITLFLNAVLTSINELIPITVDKPSLVSAPIVQTDHGALIGIIGSLQGRLIVMGEEKMFAQAGLAMYGLELSEDMLDSFVGELGNSIAGHTATRLSNQGYKIDITPPTTMQGAVKLGGFDKAIQVPFCMENGAKGFLALAIVET